MLSVGSKPVFPLMMSATDMESGKEACPLTSHLLHPGCVLGPPGEPFTNVDAWAPHLEILLWFVCGTVQPLAFF